jgi:hypothetical protein
MLMLIDNDGERCIIDSEQEKAKRQRIEARNFAIQLTNKCNHLRRHVIIT